MFRQTIQKKLIFQAVRELSHPTAKAIFKYVKERCPSVSQGTIYRGLDLLVREKKLLHIAIPNGAACYDWNNSPHYHLVCQKCGGVCDIQIPYIDALDAIDIPKMRVTDHTILFYGECPHCYQQGKRKQLT